MSQEKITEIISKIKALEIEFQSIKGLILSESDLKLNVYRSIYPIFEHSLNTMDYDIKANPIHSEIKFFNENLKLSIIPDITILQTEHLSILHSLEYEITTEGVRHKETSGKQCEFGGDTIIIELKYCKEKNGITQKDFKLYKKDILKIQKLQKIVNNRSDGMNKVYGIFVIFNKTDTKPDYFDDLIKYESEYMKILYCTGKVEFKKNNQYIKKFD